MGTFLLQEQDDLEEKLMDSAGFWQPMGRRHRQQRRPESLRRSLHVGAERSGGTPGSAPGAGEAASATAARLAAADPARECLIIRTKSRKTGVPTVVPARGSTGVKRTKARPNPAHS